MSTLRSRRVAPALLLFAITACATAGGGAPRTEARPDAAARWRAAAWNALRDPVTWAPAIGAAVVAGTSDREIADWASRETPIFRSRERARLASDHLRMAGDVAMVATTLAVDDSGRGWRGRLGRLLVMEAGAIGATGVTVGLKVVTQRERPDSSDSWSFPSAHASRGFAYRAAVYQNLDAMALPRSSDVGLRLISTGLAAGTSWARVEAGVHYPSDVLAGAALGNFVARLVQEGFLGPRRAVPAHLEIGRSGVVVVVRIESAYSRTRR